MSKFYQVHLVLSICALGDGRSDSDWLTYHHGALLDGYSWIKD